MAPLHHHYEKKGIPDSRITIRFWIIAILFALIGLATDVALIFPQLQNAESGEFDVTGLRVESIFDSFWLPVLIVSCVCALICVRCWWRAPNCCALPATRHKTSNNSTRFGGFPLNKGAPWRRPLFFVPDRLTIARACGIILIYALERR